jgi:hypothetical protein
LVAHNVPLARDGGISRLMGFFYDPIFARGHTVDYCCGEDLPKRWSGPIAQVSLPLMVFRHASKAARADGL